MALFSFCISNNLFNFCQVTSLDDSMIFFLASLPEEEYQCLLETFAAYESCELKDQTLSRAQRGVSKFAKIDCKGVNFKPLRGVSCEERKELLMKVRDGELSFSEMGETCRYTKKMNVVRNNFISYLNLDSWEEAMEKFPNFTSKERLEPFFDLQFKQGKMPPSFVSFCQQAKRSSVNEEAGTATSALKPRDDCLMVSVDKNFGVLLQKNVLTINTKEILDTFGDVGCTGLHLTILDPPEVSINLDCLL